MVDAVENKENADPIQAVKAPDPVAPGDNRAGNARNSDVSIPSGINNFALAIEMSFVQMGIFDGSVMSSGDPLTSEPERQVLIEPFMGSLMNALQSLQGPHPPRDWVDTSLKIANSGTFGMPGYQEHDDYFHGENDGLETDLLRLIQKVSSIDSNKSTNESNNSALFSLLLNFQKLIRFKGRSGDRTLGDITSLGLFLKTLSKNIQGVNATGNFINIID